MTCVEMSRNGLLANLRTIADEFCNGQKLRAMRSPACNATVPHVCDVAGICSASIVMLLVTVNMPSGSSLLGRRTRERRI